MLMGMRWHEALDSSEPRRSGPARPGQEAPALTDKANLESERRGPDSIPASERPMGWRNRALAMAIGSRS